MGYFPWGPHGPEISPNQVKPNPTPSALPAFGQPTDDFPQQSVGASGGGPSPFLSIAISLIMVPLVWMFWICLYPLTAATAIVTAFFTGTMLRRVLTASDELAVAQVGGIVAGFVAAIIVSRIEYKLTQNFAFRWARHAVRLLLFGALALPWIQAMIGNAKIDNSSTRYIFAVLSNPRFLIAQLTLPQNLAIVAGVMIAMHFVLWKGDRFRAFWHRRLFWLGLK